SHAAAGGDLIRHRHPGNQTYNGSENWIGGIARTVIVSLDKLPGQLPRGTFHIRSSALYRFDVLGGYAKAETVVFIQTNGDARVEIDGFQARRLDAVASGPVFLVIELGTKRGKNSQANAEPIVHLAGKVQI